MWFWWWGGGWRGLWHGSTALKCCGLKEMGNINLLLRLGATGLCGKVVGK